MLTPQWSTFESELRALGFSLQATAKRVKRINCRFKDQTLYVSYPFWLNQTEFKSAAAPLFARLIHKAHELHAARAHLVNSDEYYLWGCAHRFDTSLAQSRKKDWILLLYRSQLQAYLDERLPELILSTGLKPREWRVRQMSSRWGSCNTRAKRLWFSVWLSAYPKHCIDAVIVHELCHLEEANHGARFWQLVHKHCPNYDKSHAALGRELIQPALR